LRSRPESGVESKSHGVSSDVSEEENESKEERKGKSFKLILKPSSRMLDITMGSCPRVGVPVLTFGVHNSDEACFLLTHATQVNFLMLRLEEIFLVPRTFGRTPVELDRFRPLFSSSQETLIVVFQGTGISLHNVNGIFKNARLHTIPIKPQTHPVFITRKRQTKQNVVKMVPATT
jgi:hypothetical protein